MVLGDNYIFYYHFGMITLLGLHGLQKYYQTLIIPSNCLLG